MGRIRNEDKFPSRPRDGERMEMQEKCILGEESEGRWREDGGRESEMKKAEEMGK